jgi:hypothetical protein
VNVASAGRVRRLRAAFLAPTLAAWLVAGPALAAVPPPPDPKPGQPGPAAPGNAQPADAVLAEVGGLQLTRADADAYVDALVFSLAQAGQDPARLAADRAVVRDHLAESFPGLPEAAQIDLADMTGIWDRARGGWDALGATERNAFAYGVLALAFGEDEASKILRWNPRGAVVQGRPDPRQVPGYGHDAEMDCIMNGNCAPGGVRLPE